MGMYASSEFYESGFNLFKTIDLAKIIKINKPAVRVQYKLQEIGEPTLKDVLNEF